jgi:hypothetical protein
MHPTYARASTTAGDTALDSDVDAESTSVPAPRRELTRGIRNVGSGRLSLGPISPARPRLGATDTPNRSRRRRTLNVRSDPREDERDRNPRASAEAKPRPPLRARSRWRRRCCIGRQAGDTRHDRRRGTCCAGGECSGRPRCCARSGRSPAPQARHAGRRRLQASQAGAILGDGRARGAPGLGVHVRARHHRAARRGSGATRHRRRGVQQLAAGSREVSKNSESSAGRRSLGGNCAVLPTPEPNEFPRWCSAPL